MVRSIPRWVTVLALCTGCVTTSEPPGKVGVPPSAYTESTKPAPTAKAKQDVDNTMECETEYPTGSRIPVRNCRSLRQKEADRQASQDFMNRTLQLQPQNVRGGGG